MASNGKSKSMHRPTREEMFGESFAVYDARAAAAAAAGESPNRGNGSNGDGEDSVGLYVPASAVQGQPGSAALYVTPESLKGGGIEVGSLSQLAEDGIVSLGGQLDAVHFDPGADATGVRVVGASAFGQFLCGRYRRMTGVVYNERPVYRSAEPANGACPAFCTGHHMFLFYHARNSAWVIGMKVNAGSGACAYVPTSEALPTDVDVASSPWHVSMENGGFSRQPSMKCVRDACQDIPPPKGFKLPGVGEDFPAGRHEAEEMLLRHMDKLPGATGYHVLRESTSVPNAFVISILLSQADVEHIILTQLPDGNYTVVPEYTRGKILACSLIGVIDYGYIQGFTIRGEVVKLGRCIHGESLASST